MDGSPLDLRLEHARIGNTVPSIRDDNDRVTTSSTARLAEVTARLVCATFDPQLTDADRDALAAVLEAAVPPGRTVPTRFTEGERAAFGAGRGDIDARGTHPLRGTASAGRIVVSVLPDGMVVTFDVRHEGIPGHAHGSFVAGFFDVALGKVAIDHGGVGLTRQLDVRFRAPAPLHTAIRYTGRVTGYDGPTTVVEGAATTDGTEVATARLTFVHGR